MSEPQDFSMDMADEGTEAAVEATDAATDAPMDATASSGGGSVADGLLSTEPDVTAADAGQLFDTSEPWTAHAEVFARKFLYAYGMDGNPAVLHLFVAIATLTQEMQQADSEDDEDDSDVFHDDSELDELPE